MGALSSSKCFRPFLLPAMVLRQAARALAGSLGEMQSLRPHPRPVESVQSAWEQVSRSERGSLRSPLPVTSPICPVPGAEPQVPVKCLLLCATMFSVFSKAYWAWPYLQPLANQMASSRGHNEEKHSVPSCSAALKRVPLEYFFWAKQALLSSDFSQQRRFSVIPLTGSENTDLSPHLPHSYKHLGFGLSPAGEVKGQADFFF